MSTVLFTTQPEPHDAALRTRLDGFVPEAVFDIHAHLFDRRFYPADALPSIGTRAVLGCADHQAAVRRAMPNSTLAGALYFAFPHAAARHEGLNAWAAQEVAAHGGALSRLLLLVSPADSREAVAARFRSDPRICGLKVYHLYADKKPTWDAGIEDYAPEWMWELLEERSGVLMLHVVKDRAMEDADNQAALRRLCRRYPRARVVLAHIARSFCHRHARRGLEAVASLDNVVVDTSAVCDPEAFRHALEILGPRRVLWGTDFPVSEFRGRCVTAGDGFHWLFSEEQRAAGQPGLSTRATTVGLESLLALRDACEAHGCTAADVRDIFHDNALRLLAPSFPAEKLPAAVDVSARWQRARAAISGGTGLLSKRAEQFDPQTWPAFFSRCRGCEVWDANGRRHLDFVGGVGAVLLGYADPGVDAAVRRRVAAGSYCSLASTDELELAERLLALHPWAGRVRFARGGGEALAVAVRVARAATGRSGVAFCGYHGWHDWYLAANLGETDALHGHLLPGLEPAGVPAELRGTAVPFRYNDLASLDAALARLGGNLAAVVMEPMRSQQPQGDFLAEVARRCRAAGAVWVIDEVTSGLRYGFPGAMARLGLEPDVAVYAKAMSNGYPFAAVVGRAAIMDAADRSFISSSYWTDGIGPAAALAVLRTMETENVFAAVWEKGARLQTALQTLATRHTRCRATIGVMPPTPHLAFDLGAQTAAARTLYTRRLAARGVLASSVCYVMHAHDDAATAHFLAAADETLGEIADLLARGDLEAAVGRTTAAGGFARLA